MSLCYHYYNPDTNCTGVRRETCVSELGPSARSTRCVFQLQVNSPPRDDRIPAARDPPPSLPPPPCVFTRVLMQHTANADVSLHSDAKTGTPCPFEASPSGMFLRKVVEGKGGCWCLLGEAGWGGDLRDQEWLCLGCYRARELPCQSLHHGLDDGEEEARERLCVHSWVSLTLCSKSVFLSQRGGSESKGGSEGDALATRPLHPYAVDEPDTSATRNRGGVTAAATKAKQTVRRGTEIFRSDQKSYYVCLHIVVVFFSLCNSRHFRRFFNSSKMIPRFITVISTHY